MLRSLVGGLCAIGSVVLVASAASAAVIDDYEIYDFDPTVQDFALYTPSAYLMTWDTTGGNLAPPGHSPGGPPSYGPPGGNPAWLKFNDISGGGGGGGGGAGNTLSTFVLGNEYGNAWTMDFYVMIFDADFGGEKINVYVIGEDLGQSDNEWAVSVEADDVKTGKLLKWHIDAGAGEDVTVHIESVGDVSYAAGFMMGNESVGNPPVPEPATVALVGLGAAWVAARRRRRR